MYAELATLSVFSATAESYDGRTFSTREVALNPLILALDDELDILEILRMALGSEGYEVITATTAAEFRSLHAENDVSLFLVDLSLPDGNGFSLVRELRKTTDRGIVILTGRASETDHVVGLELGADDYITKPFRQRELVARVNAVIRRTNIAEPEILGPALVAAKPTIVIDFTFDDYQISVQSRRIWHKTSGEIVLTTAEFDLLLALLRRRGQVLDRDQLMNAMKGRDWESYDRAIDGLVSRLRRKLPAVGRATHYIRTVQGIGYAFAD